MACYVSNMPVPSLSINDDLLDRVDEERHNTPRSEWLRAAARMRLDIEDAADAAGIDTEGDWWQDELYDAMRERFGEVREREAARDEQDTEPQGAD